MDTPAGLDYTADGVVTGHCGNVVFTVSRTAATVEALRETYVVARNLAADYHGGFAQLIVTQGGSPMPGAEERQVLQRLARELGPQTLATCIVLEGEGLWLSSMRAVARTMMLAIRTPHPQQMFAGVPEGVRWLVRVCGSHRAFEATELAQWVEQGRRQVMAAA